MWAASAARSLLISGSRFILRQIGAREKIGTDHLEAIASRFISSEHQACCFEGLLDHRKLALVQLEIGDLLRLGLFPCQLSFNRTFESFFRHPLRLVQPGCTIELVPIPPATSTSSVALLQPTCCQVVRYPIIRPVKDEERRNSATSRIFAASPPISPNPADQSSPIQLPLSRKTNSRSNSKRPGASPTLVPRGCMHLKQFVLILLR